MKILITEKQYKRILKEQNGFVEIDPDYALAGYVGINSPMGAVLVPNGTSVNLYTDQTESDDFANFKKWRNTKWEWWIPNKNQLKRMLGLDKGKGPTVSKFKLPDGKIYIAKFGNYEWKNESDSPKPDAWRFENYVDSNGNVYQPPKSPKPLIDSEIKTAIVTIGAIIGSILFPEAALAIGLVAGSYETYEHLRRSEKGYAAITAALTLLPFVPYSAKLAKYLKKVNVDDLIVKMRTNSQITEDEFNFLKNLSDDSQYLSQIESASQKIIEVEKDVSDFINTYKTISGEDSYKNLLKSYIQNKINKNQFINNVKSPSLPKGIVSFGSTKFTNEDDFIEFIKNKFPMSNEEAVEFIKNYSKTGRNANRDFYQMGYSWASGDNIKVATILKYKIKPPVGEFLYHGTASERLPSIIKRGLDNSISPKPLNPGTMPTKLGEGVTTATGDIRKAFTYSKGSSDATKTKPVIIRFPNENNEPVTFFSTHKAITPNKLEFSFDDGKTWVKDPTPYLNK
jgi:hypothetical protein